MKKLITAGITIISCVALCAAVWPRSIEVEDLPTESVKSTVTAEIEALSEETQQILFSGVTQAPEIKDATEIELSKTNKTAEEKTETARPTETTPHAVSKSASTSTKPKSGDRAVIDGKPHIWIPGFGWIEDKGGGSVGTMVGNPGDELTGNKVGIMGGSTTVDGKGDINKQVGIMGADNTQPSERHNPAPGSKAVVDGKPSIWVPGFVWIEDNGGGNVGTVVEDMYENGNKIGIMD